jgi:hypothetical protein
MRVGFGFIGGVLACVLVLGMGVTARAHPGVNASAVVTVKRDGAIIVQVHHDALAFALNDISQRIDDEPMNQLLDGPPEDLAQALQEGRERFQALMRVEADGAPIALRLVEGPTPEMVRDWLASGRTPRIPVKLEFVSEGSVPRDARTLVFFFPEILSDVVVTVERPGEEPISMVAFGGQPSPGVPIDLRVAVAPASVSDAGDQKDQPSQQDQPRVLNPMGFIVLGFEHILPDGLDHILFVLGLFLLNARLKPLLIQITCFTVAHSVTLALAASGHINVPGSIVEPVIAASIAFVAIENLFTTKVHPWRPVLIVAFGLIHGLGFAGAFQESIGAERVPLGPVLLFNVGVELGQLAVVGIAFVLVGWALGKPWYRKWVAIPASLAIAAAGLWWTVERTLLG